MDSKTLTTELVNHVPGSSSGAYNLDTHLQT